MNNDKKALKSGLWYTLSNFLLRSIGFITTPIFTRLLTQEEFGAYNNYTSWLHIFTIIVTLDLGATLISAKYDYEDRYDQYIFSMLGLSTLSAVVWFLFVNIFSETVKEFLGMDLLYVNCMFAYLIFYAAVNLFQIRERYLFNYLGTVFSSIFISVGTAILSVILVLTMNNRLTGRILGSVIPTVVFGIFLFAFFIYRGKTIDFHTWKYAIPICLPYIPHLLSLTLLNSMDRVMITSICGERETGLYSLAYNCGAIVTLLITSMNNAYSPWLGEQLHNGGYERIRSFSKKYIVIFSYLAIGVMLLAPEVLLILGGAKYLEAKYVMAPVAMGCVCQFLYTMFVNVEQYNKKTIGMAFASTGAALVNYVLNYYFIRKYGYVAAAYTTLAGYLFLLVMHMLLVKRIGFHKVYSYRFVLLTVVCMIGITMIINFLYQLDILRYIIIVLYMSVLLTVGIKNKQVIRSFVGHKNIGS